MSKLRTRIARRWLNFFGWAFTFSLLAASVSQAQAPAYSIQAIRIADSPGDSVGEMAIGAPRDEKIDTMYAVWLIRGGGHNILFDSGLPPRSLVQTLDYQGFPASGRSRKTRR